MCSALPMRWERNSRRQRRALATAKLMLPTFSQLVGSDATTVAWLEGCGAANALLPLPLRFFGACSSILRLLGRADRCCQVMHEEDDDGACARRGKSTMSERWGSCCQVEAAGTIAQGRHQG